MFGVTESGNSVAAHVHNFTAYFYVHVIESEYIDLQALEQLRVKLSRQVQVNKEDPEAVIRIEQVKKNSVMNY